MNRDLAIVGMVCKVPGAESIADFWSMLCEGREGLRPLSSEECKSTAKQTAAHMVYAGGFLKDIDRFDPEQFGYTARDALYMDPQQRLFLQACWEALEVSANAGNNLRSVGVFATSSFNAYLTEVILKQGINEQQQQSTLIGNASDCLATRVSYCLNLTGPSMTIQSGCSSSLVALHQARLALLANQCDAALVGGVSLIVPHCQGYSYVEGGFASKDGHCRPFSEDAGGTVFSSGYGVIVVKRLQDAIDSGDTIYSVIKGSAINNDGSDKAGFTAPSVRGQAQVIAKALRVAQVSPETMQYIEAHGTATPIGDPIELAALKEVYTEHVMDSCVLGSVKANIGHLDVAAGIIGLIKTSLMLYFKTLTPQIHFTNWNTRIVGGASPFKINASLKEWDVPENTNRRAGVSAFGFGGTNAHVVLEGYTAPNTIDNTSSNACSNLIVLSAKSADRLLQWIKTLRLYLINTKNLSLPQLAYSLQVGRKQDVYRYAVEATSISSLIDHLDAAGEEDIVCTDSLKKPLLCSDKKEDLKATWLSGVVIDWSTLYLKPMTKCFIPAAPLKTQSYWLKITSEENTPIKSQDIRAKDVDKWLYHPAWQQVQTPLDVNLDELKPLLLIGLRKNTSLQALITYCKDKTLPYCWIEPGEQLVCRHSQDEEGQYFVLGEWDGLNRYLGQMDYKPETLIQWPMVPEDFADSGEMILDSLQYIVNLTSIKSVSLVAYVVSGMSSLFCPSNNPNLQALIAFSRGIRQEFPHLTTKVIDTDPSEDIAITCEQLLRTIQDDALQDICVWRNTLCWQEGYRHFAIEKSQAHYFKKKGVYLITGGLGNVASVHVNFLAKDFDATLVLVGRTPIPPEDKWPQLLEDTSTSDALKKKISQLSAWKKQGFTIITQTADITSFDALQTVCLSIKESIGPIDGIIHIAGAGSDMHYKLLSALTAAHCELLFAPKIKGIEVIGSVMDVFNIPNCLIISSISSALAGIGLSAYAASHNLLDAYVKKNYIKWRIMNWDAWNFHNDSKQDENLGALGSSMDQLAISPDEGLHVLRAAFERPHWQQLYISSTDLSSRVKRWVFRQEKSTASIVPSNLSPRPVLRTDYVIASIPLHQQLADLWSTLIGVAPIGIHDNFFELGGDSLLALELIAQLHKKLGKTCTVSDLFEAATIAKLAKKISPDSQETNRFELIKARAARKRNALNQYIPS